MNKYDDIKQFKDKIDMHHIDYKEISEGEIQGGTPAWPLIVQLASQGNDSPLDNGRTIQPTPQQVSVNEFTAFTAPDTSKNRKESPPVNNAPLLNTRSVATTRPISQSLFPAPPAPITLAKPEPQKPISNPTPTVVFSAPSERVESGNTTEFKHIFSPKDAHANSVGFEESSRDIPLQMLLESIALCR